jgi:hypothetical protein
MNRYSESATFAARLDERQHRDGRHTWPIVTQRLLSKSGLNTRSHPQ